MSLFRSSGGANYVGVRDIPSATQWYVDKLELRKMKADMDDCPECVALGFAKDEYALTLGPAGKPTDELRPILFASDAGKARDVLARRGVRTGEVQHDAQGTRYFEMQDLEGNVIEISEEP